VIICSSLNGKSAVPSVLSSVPPTAPPPSLPHAPALPPVPPAVSSSFTHLDAASTDIKHEPKSPMPADSVYGPGVGLNLTGSGGGGGGGVETGGGSAFSGETTGIAACNGHAAARYSSLVTAGGGASTDLSATRCPLTAVPPTLMNDDDAPADPAGHPPPTKRIHFADTGNNGWSP